MKTVGDKFPKFKKPAILANKQFVEISGEDHKKEGKWMVMFWYPKDFTFICPTEIVEFNRNHDKFTALNTVLYGASTDTEEVHLAWRNNHEDLKNLGFPMLADVKKELTGGLGVLHPQELIPLRATYIVDPDGIIRWASVNDLNVGRNVKEVVRTLDALQTDELCPCNWEKGQATLG